MPKSRAGAGLGGEIGGGARRGDLAGQGRQIVLDRLEFGDRPAELRAVERVLHRLVEDLFERAGHLLRAHRGAETLQHVGVDVGGLDRFRGRAVERDGVARLAGEALVMADRQARGRDQRHRPLVAACGPARRYARRCGRTAPARARPASRPSAPSAIWPSACTGAIVIGPAGAAIPARASSQPAIKVSASGTGAANRPAARSTAKPSAIAAPAPPSSSGTQVSGQPRFLERIPQRLRPHAFFGVVDRGGLAQILKDPGRGIDDDVVGGCRSSRYPLLGRCPADRSAGEAAREAAWRQTDCAP